MNIIVLDGNQRSALAVTRSLGKRGLTITVGAETTPSLAGCSKYCKHSFSYPSPYQKPDDFFHSICDHISNHHELVMIPMADVTISELLEKRDRIHNNVKIPFAEYAQYKAASDKVNVFNLAREFDIPAPKTLFSSECKNREDIVAKSRKIGFPLVVKPGHSRIRTEAGWKNTSVCYANNVDELITLLAIEPFKSHPFIIQERIEGPGIGIFLLMHEGAVLAKFAHRRTREKPPSGGVSVLCESIMPPPDAYKNAERLLKKLNWYGIAMVEFKWDRRENVPKLMEINARFWGSLELAIAAGVDFPFLLYCLATGQKIDPPHDYKIGVKSRWELGDLDHLLIRMKKKNKDLALPIDAPSRFGVLKDFILDSFKPSIRNEVLQLDDPRPFLFELQQYIKELF